MTTRGRGLAVVIPLALGMAVATHAQFVLGALGPLLRDAIGLTRGELGLVFTLMFAVGGVCSPLAGRIIDAIGGRRALVVLFVAGGTGLLTFATASALTSLFLGAVFAGVAMSLGNPATNTVIAGVTRPEGRGTVVGGTQAGVQAGALYAGSVAPAVAVGVGWRGGLASGVLLALAGLAAALVLVPRTARVERRAEPLEPAEHRASRRLGGYAFLMAAAASCVFAYLPLYANEEVGYAPAIAATVAAAFGVVGLVSRITIGRLADLFPDRAVPLAAMGATAALAIGLLGLAPSQGRVWLWIGCVVFGFSGVAWPAVVMLGVVRAVRPAAMGRVSGRVSIGLFAGLLVTPALFGWSVDSTGSYAAGWSGVALLFLAAATVGRALVRRQVTAVPA